MNSVIKMAVSASPESRSKTGTSDSYGLVLKLRGTRLAVWIYFGFKADKEGIFLHGPSPWR